MPGTQRRRLPGRLGPPVYGVRCALPWDAGRLQHRRRTFTQAVARGGAGEPRRGLLGPGR